MSAIRTMQKAFNTHKIVPNMDKNPIAVENAVAMAALKIEANISQLSSMTKMDCINEIFSIIYGEFIIPDIPDDK